VKREKEMSKLALAVRVEDHSQGNLTAACTLVEYGDYECLNCAEANPIVKKLQRHFGDNLLLVFRNFPLSEQHPWAEAAAETAEFAAAHGKFWEAHDLLYDNQRSFGPVFFLQLSERIDLSSEGLQIAVREKTYRSRVTADFAGGVRSGVNGTPTFFINGLRHNGTYEFESLSGAIARALGQQLPDATE
jgi:protein-disulfide isomerase